MVIDPSTARHQDLHKLLIGGVVPRPIAFVSTVSHDGVRNLAPFSFFTVISIKPTVICFCPGPRIAEQPCKDTLSNIYRTREFVVNIVSEEIGEQMNLTSGEYAPYVDEFEISGLTPLESDLVRPPRVAESHFQMECRLYLTIEVSGEPGGGNLVLGEVVRFHVDDALFDNFKIDPDKLRAIGRMGGNAYTRTADRFDMIRPKA